jgi:hypothetical protein
VSLSTLAVLVCWLAILLTLLGLAPLVLALAGAVVGHIAQGRTTQATAERRLALVGIILGYLGVIASVGVMIFAATHGAR